MVVVCAIVVLAQAVPTEGRRRSAGRQPEANQWILYELGCNALPAWGRLHRIQSVRVVLCNEMPCWWHFHRIYDLFYSEFEEQAFKFQCHGTIFNKNKIEDFRTCDKIALICDEGRLIWDDIVSGRCLQTPSLFTRFIVLSFAVSNEARTCIDPDTNWISYSLSEQDLKSFNYYYWFAYPCPSEPMVEKADEHKSITAELSDGELQQLNDIYFQLSNEKRTFFILRRAADALDYLQLTDKIDANRTDDNFADDDLAEYYFCFSDPSTSDENAAWPLRLFLLAVTHLWFVKSIRNSISFPSIERLFFFCSPKLRGKSVKILSLRVKKAISLETSVVYSVRLPSEDVTIDTVKWVGWEANAQGKYLPKCASMASSMDPQKYARLTRFPFWMTMELNVSLLGWPKVASIWIWSWWNGAWYPIWIWRRFRPQNVCCSVRVHWAVQWHVISSLGAFGP